MGWLKTVGQILAKGLEIATGILPIVQASVPNSSTVIQMVSADLAAISQVVVQAEAMGAALGLPGVDKLKAAAPNVAQIILSSSLLAGKQIQDPAKFQQGVNEIASGVADVLSSLSAASVQTQSKIAA